MLQGNKQMADKSNSSKTKNSDTEAFDVSVSAATGAVLGTATGGPIGAVGGGGVGAVGGKVTHEVTKAIKGDGNKKEK